MHAADKDSPANAAITYHIVNGDPEKRFSVDPLHGMVQVEKPLDRETVGHDDIYTHLSPLFLVSGGVCSIVVPHWTAGQQIQKSILHLGHDS